MGTSGADVDGFDRDEVIHAARRFYLHEHSKVEIAQEMGLSRFKVARMLEAARESGLVTITIDDDGAPDATLGERLAQTLGLERALVVSSAGTGDAARTTVGRAAAALLSGTLTSGEVLGMGWGRTLSALAAAIERLPPVSAVQMTGATELTGALTPLEIVRALELHGGGPVTPIFAPLVVDDAQTAAAFRRQPGIAKALAMHEQVTTAVMSFGGWDLETSQLAGATEPQLRADLVERGVVAEIGVTLVDAHGQEVAPDFSERCIAVTSARLRAIERVIGVAAGAAKGPAAVALARAGLVTELVVDRALAEEALARVE